MVSTAGRDLATKRWLSTASTIGSTRKGVNTVTGDSSNPDSNGTWFRELKDEVKGYVDFLLEHYTFVLSALYLYITGVGLLYSFLLYREFRVNIFDYFEISDFLIAALKNPMVVLSAALPI